ncbi:cobalamin biosynthesis protein CbiX [Thiorhodococcus mannitoliphagus]|uniref:Cobalamin biosynthesis protein CbiX n=1 Tax=Thiorhodococcus mannitoliphagus TaxID=329406 RepID=A0A6P1DYF7_9GAMM|nr:CbiX/SirB N-terminal domain-containing protein [Thiorhodococcus mannitoliphagus]NEX23248.1 cobalamin biosynthesis protein CbiX [Thiorhodococcus mannitoliphagus]
MPTFILADNGSKRPESTLNLRRLAATLSQRAGTQVDPVSLLHSDRIPADLLGGQPAETLAPALARLVRQGHQALVLIPLFFGPSRALSQFVPETAARVANDCGAFSLQVAPALCPLPTGEPRLVDILYDNLMSGGELRGMKTGRAILVDHGSPIPEVTAVRHWLGERLQERLEEEVRLEQAVMERREGAAYDFNGPLLEDLLGRLAEEDATAPVTLSMLFLSAGRHAGPEGDIRDICRRVSACHPGLEVRISPLVGDHPGLVDILLARLTERHRWNNLSPAAG